MRCSSVLWRHAAEGSSAASTSALPRDSFAAPRSPRLMYWPARRWCPWSARSDRPARSARRTTSSAAPMTPSTSDRLFAEIAWLMSDWAMRTGSPVARAAATASAAQARTWSVASTLAPPTIARRPSRVARRCSSSGGSASSASSKRRTRGRSGTNAVTHRLAPASALARVRGSEHPRASFAASWYRSNAGSRSPSQLRTSAKSRATFASSSRRSTSSAPISRASHRRPAAPRAGLRRRAP